MSVTENADTSLFVWLEQGQKNTPNSPHIVSSRQAMAIGLGCDWRSSLAETKACLGILREDRLSIGLRSSDAFVCNFRKWPIHLFL